MGLTVTTLTIAILVLCTLNLAVCAAVLMKNRDLKQTYHDLLLQLQPLKGSIESGNSAVSEHLTRFDNDNHTPCRCTSC